MAISQGTFDIVFDAIKSTLIAYSVAQDPADRYTTYADYYRMFPASNVGSNVFLYMGAIVPTERTTMGYDEQSVSYFIDMIVKAKGAAGASYGRADEAAGVRFRLLVQQILTALHGSDNFNFGLPAGTLGKKEIRVDPLSPEQQVGEQIVAAGRLTITASMCYQPADITGIDLESILITADKWSALITEP